MAQPPHPANVPGDFYVEDGCCTLCEVPLTEAADLFGWWPNSEAPEHCFVKRQPQNAAELERMVSAISCAELQCIHYRGTDRDFQVRLVKIGEGLACDNLPPDLQWLRRYQLERLKSEQANSVWGRIRKWWQRRS